MQLVDLTGIWRDGVFYKVKANKSCRGCAFFHDDEIKGKQCYDVLGCEAVLGGVKRESIYIKTDDESVANYVRQRLEHEAREK